MGFFSKLKKVVAGIDKGAAIAAAASGSIPGKAGQVTGQVAGDVTQGAGVVTAVVQQIQAKSGSEVPPEEAQKQATLVTAVAVDDHEDRLKQLENILKGVQAVAGAAQGTQAGQGSQAGQGTQAGGGSAAGQGTQAGGGSQAGQGEKT
jgi:hypothetical protein